jgi:hypothetical protein
MPAAWQAGSSHSPDTAAPLFNITQLSEYTADDSVAEPRHALAHVLHRHSKRQQARVFYFQTVVEECKANGSTSLGIICMDNRVEIASRTARTLSTPSNRPA